MKSVVDDKPPKSKALINYFKKNDFFLNYRIDLLCSTGIWLNDTGSLRTAALMVVCLGFNACHAPTLMDVVLCV